MPLNYHEPVFDQLTKKEREQLFPKPRGRQTITEVAERVARTMTPKEGKKGKGEKAEWES